MASIFERKDRGKICVAWYDAKGGRHTKFFPLNQRREAKKFAAEADLSTTAMAVSRIDVETAITYFLEDRHAVRSPRTYERYKNILLQFLKYVCPDGRRRQLATVTPLIIEQWRNERQQKRSPWTVRVDLKIVRSFYNWCIKKQWAKTNTAAMVDLPAPKRRFPRYLHPDQVNELLARLKVESPTEFYPIALFAARAGLRRSEILFLLWEHVDLDRKLILVHGKSKDPRAVPLHEDNTSTRVCDQHQKGACTCPESQ
jgi:site-specific recombinase XerD